MKLHSFGTKMILIVMTILVMAPGLAAQESSDSSESEITRYEPEQPEPEEKASWLSFFPLLKDRIPEEQRELLPRPYGLAYIFHTQNQWFSMSDVVLQGINIPTGLLDAVRVNSITSTHTLKADLWLLPFLNIFVMGGVANGTADVYIQNGNMPQTIGLSFPVNITTLGGGLTAAAGYRRFFITGTYTIVNIFRANADNSISQAFTPLVGYSFPVFNLWIGAQWQDTSRKQGGYLGDIRYDIDLVNENPWNMVTGFRFILVQKRLDLVYQQGIGQRSSSTVNLVWRFGE